MIADSSKPNKLQNVYTIRSTTRNVVGILYIVKVSYKYIKYRKLLVYFIYYTLPTCTFLYKKRKASKSRFLRYVRYRPLKSVLKFTKVN